MIPTHLRLLSVPAICLELSLALAATPAARSQNTAPNTWRGQLALAVHSGQGQDGLATQGRDALATKEASQEPAPGQASENLPAPITVEHHGRLLVLNYGPKPGSGALMANPGPRGEPPGFVILKGQRPVVTGQFEYG